VTEAGHGDREGDAAGERHGRPALELEHRVAADMDEVAERLMRFVVSFLWTVPRESRVS
jgi:hypothetical protein